MCIFSTAGDNNQGACLEAVVASWRLDMGFCFVIAVLFKWFGSKFL